MTIVRRLSLILVSVFVCWNVQGALGAAEGEGGEPRSTPPTPAFWTATKGADTVYLFGSVHVGNEAMYPIPAIVDQRFGESEALALEVDMVTKGMEAAQLMAAKAYYVGDDDMTKHLKPESVQLIKDLLAKRNVNFDLMKKAKPWFLVQSIMMGEVLKMGFKMDLGIDMHFGTRARDQGTPILELEDIRDQVNLLDDLDQDMMVQFSLGPLEEGGKELFDLIDIWIKGDVPALAKMAVDDPLQEYPEIEPFYERFLFARNATMVANLDKHLEKYDRIFVIVGAAHLVGDRSVIDLMEQQDWQIELYDHQADQSGLPAGTMPAPAGP